VAGRSPRRHNSSTSSRRSPLVGSMGHFRVAFLSLLKVGKSDVIGAGLGCAKAVRFKFLIRAFSRSAFTKDLVTVTGTAGTAAMDEAPGVVGVSV